MVIKYITIFQAKAPKIYPNWDFWFEKKPSGNPDPNDKSSLFKTHVGRMQSI
jgi:hypothetical protein